MFDDADRTYYLTRALCSRRQAERAESRDVAGVHRQMADRYDAIVEARRLPEPIFG